MRLVKPQNFLDNSGPSNIAITFQSTIKELDPIQVTRMFGSDFSEMAVNNNIIPIPKKI